jgi:hypothetical protein
MKISAIILVIVLGLRSIGDAQVSVRVNIGLQPVWGPVGYDYAEYYYLPDIEAYYYVPERRFYYMEGGVWVNALVLPGRYHDFDLYRAHKIVINEPRPYLHHSVYRARYGSYKGYHGQGVIRDSHESKYWEIKEHPEHSKWKGNEGRHEGNGNGNNHGGGRR